MGLFRIVLIAVAVFLILSLLKWLRNRHSAILGKDNSAIDRMVKCEHCGLYISSGDAVQADGHVYCCREHRDTDEQARGHDTRRW